MKKDEFVLLLLNGNEIFVPMKHSHQIVRAVVMWKKWKLAC